MTRSTICDIAGCSRPVCCVAESTITRDKLQVTIKIAMCAVCKAKAIAGTLTKLGEPLHVKNYNIVRDGALQ